MSIKNIYIKYKKSAIALLSTTFILLIFLGFQGFKYNSLMSEFKTHFDSNKFTDASNSLVSNCKLNIFKEILLEDNLSTYFRNKLSDVNSKLESKNISNDEAFVIVNEINKYNLIDTEVKAAVSVISKNVGSDSLLTKGIVEFQKGNFKETIELLSSIQNTDITYEVAATYLSKSKASLKSNILKEADEHAKNDYYSKGINILENNLKILDNDKDILTKIDDLNKKKNEYLNINQNKTQGNPSMSTSNLVSSISTSTINSLWVESLTPYLIFVDQNSQKTFIYSGKVNNWNLEKEMPCSTGIEGRETPSGVFDVREKGKWFFSDKYGQGGKYYTQFQGDYLFHSLPYAKDAETVVDYTLGKPASHGCIRLPLDDAKWIFDNIPSGTKVIIN